MNVMTIVYAGEELMTGDEIAQALLKYSEALAERLRLDGGDPDPDRRWNAFDGHGARRPASQIVARPVEPSFEELLDPEW